MDLGAAAVARRSAVGGHEPRERRRDRPPVWTGAVAARGLLAGDQDPDVVPADRPTHPASSSPSPAGRRWRGPLGRVIGGTASSIAADVTGPS